MSDRVDLREFVGGFVVESDELVAAANAALLDIDAGNAEGSARPRAVRDLFRALHTLKGLAGMLGVEPIVEVAHALETLVRAADRVGGRLRRGAVELCLQGVRAIGDRVRAVAEGRPVEPAPDRLLDAIAATDQAAAAEAPTVSLGSSWDVRLTPAERAQVVAAVQARRDLWTVSFTPSDERAGRGITIASVRSRVSALAEIIKVVPRKTELADAPAGLVFDLLVSSTATEAQLAEAVDAPADAVRRLEIEVAAPAAEPELEIPELGDEPVQIGRSVIRVELARLDELQDQLSLLLVARFRLDREIARLAAAGGDARGFRQVAELQARLLRDLRRAILRARMVRVAEILEPLPLIVRSVARAADKEVALVIDAQGSELDKAVADRLLPAIVHLVRNAVDHAIEPADERERAGKPRAGRIGVVCVERAGSQLEVAISDDGRGIDRAEVARRAGRAIDDDAALLDVLATPGFSTRDVATSTSGRGLGMDIVRRITVSELGGELVVASAPGQGTTFTLRVPLTIAIVDAFSFECGGQAFVVPVASIEEIFELGDDRAASLPAAAPAAAPVALHERRGRAIPVVALGSLLSLEPAADPRKALVVRRNGEPMAFAVDRMLGRHEVVVRPIDDPLARIVGVAGATDLGDGRPTLVLDLAELGAAFHARQECS
jgi:two-component system, chemotaxis family, sensor kinase CheA